MPASRQPIFLLPPVLSALAVALIVAHGLQLTIPTDTLLLWFAFIPARYSPQFAGLSVLPGGPAADIWTFVTYAFLHGNVMHLLVNLVWLVAFGRPVALRFGHARFIGLLAVTAAAGAAVHLLTHWGTAVPLIGASAAVSGVMAAALRFVFAAGGPLQRWNDPSGQAHRIPAEPLLDALRNPSVLVFLVIWVGFNFLFATDMARGLTADPVAWQAHLGGFAAGLLLFLLFDPIPRKEGVA